MGFNLFKLFFQTFLGKKILRIIQLFIKFSFTFLQWKSLICTQCIRLVGAHCSGDLELAVLVHASKVWAQATDMLPDPSPSRCCLVSFFFCNTPNYQSSKTCGLSSNYLIGPWATHKISLKSNPQCLGPSYYARSSGYGLKYLTTKHSIFLGPLHELNRWVSLLHHGITTILRASSICIRCIQALAFTLNEHYILTNQVDDLEQSILHYIEVIFLPPHWDTNIAQNLFSIVQLLLSQAIHTKQPKDIKPTIIYLRYLHGQSPKAFWVDIPSDIVKENLVLVLTLQVWLELGDMMQDIEEMADIFLKLLNSDIWMISTNTITSFVEVVKHQHERWEKGKEPPTKVIDCLWKVKIHLPDSDQLSITLACTLLDRFCIAYLNDDYEEGTAILDQFLTSHAPGLGDE